MLKPLIVSGLPIPLKNSNLKHKRPSNIQRNRPVSTSQETQTNNFAHIDNSYMEPKLTHPSTRRSSS